MIDIAAPNWLRIAYAANIIILAPVCYSMFLGDAVGAVFEGKVPESDGLRLLVGSLWLAILISSMAGLLWPAFFAPIILVQIIYKLVWLATFTIPIGAANGVAAVPLGISTTFALIVFTYPILLWLSAR